MSAMFFTKRWFIFAGSNVAGIIMGASAPMILTSRADSSDTKFNSIALACILAERGVFGAVIKA